jgi:hypothetical protein
MLDPYPAIILYADKQNLANFLQFLQTHHADFTITNAHGHSVNQLLQELRTLQQHGPGQTQVAAVPTH